MKMSVELKYKHQQKTYELMENRLEKTGRAAFSFPTGAGKSFLPLKYIEDNPEENILIVVSSKAIANQFKSYIKEYIEDGDKLLESKKIAIVTYQKLGLLKGKVENARPDIIIYDEAHRIGAETWEPAVDELEERFPKAKEIAMTATPERTDKRNMLYEKFGDDVVYEMSLTEALSGEKEEEVVLKSPRYVRVLSTLAPELKEYKKRIQELKDESTKERLLKKYERLESIISASPDIQDVMQVGMKKKNGKYIVFCENKEDLQEKMAHAKEIFGKVNQKIKIDYVASKNGKEDDFGKTEAQNRRTLEEFQASQKEEELQLLFCVDMLNEGVHLQGLDGEVMFRATESSIIYKQHIGRVLSADEEEKTVIIDAVNNWLRQEEAFEEIAGAIQKGDGLGNHKFYDLLKLMPEELELLDILREIKEETRYNYYDTYNQIIRWLEEHEGKMPRSGLGKNGKVLVRSEMTEEEREETKLYTRWWRCPEKKILEEYVEKPIEEVPEEYREKIKILRNYGLGLKIKSTYEEIIEWLEEYKGKMPRSAIIRNGKQLSREEITEEEREEIKLYGRWYTCPERKIIEEYVGRPIEEVPEEYREKIKILRNYGLRLKMKSTYGEIIEWLEEHEGKMPRSGLGKNGKVLVRSEMTEEERKETKLYARWWKCPERKILDEYVGKPIGEVPEKYRDRIKVLRDYGLGLEVKSTYEEIIEWLEEHEGKMPRSGLGKNGKVLVRSEMTEEERKETKLYTRWWRCPEKKILDKHTGRPIEEVPEQYREKIARLRELGQLGTKKDDQIKTRMKKTVSKHVGNNKETRKELDGKQEIDLAQEDEIK